MFSVKLQTKCVKILKGLRHLAVVLHNPTNLTNMLL